MFGANYFGQPYFGGVPVYTAPVIPTGYYPFICDQNSVVMNKETACANTVADSQNTDNKLVFNSLNNCK